MGDNVAAEYGNLSHTLFRLNAATEHNAFMISWQFHPAISLSKISTEPIVYT